MWTPRDGQPRGGGAVGRGGEPLTGFTREECQTVPTDSVRQTVVWKWERAPSDRAAACDLRFHLQNARLYSFRIDGTDAS